MTRILWSALLPCISLEVLTTIAFRLQEVLAYTDCDWMQEKNIGASALVTVGGWRANNDLLTGDLRVTVYRHRLHFVNTWVLALYLYDCDRIYDSGQQGYMTIAVMGGRNELTESYIGALCFNFLVSATHVSDFYKFGACLSFID